MIKGKITSKGILVMARAGIEIPCICPKESQGILYCNHTCALFGEPVPAIDKVTRLKIGSLLQLCSVTIVFDSLIDEREDNSDESILESKQ